MHPIILKIPGLGLPVYSYGLMLGISFVVGWYLTMYFVEKDGINRQHASTALTLAIIGALLGARILYFVTNPGTMKSLGDFFAFNRGGLVAYGGFIGGALVAGWYIRSKKVPFLRLADHAAPALALGTAITRLGCFMYGCCYGAVTQVPWAVRFPQGSPAYYHHLREGLIGSGATHSLGVFPTQLHETGYGLLIFAILLMARRVKNRFQGMIFLLFAGLYAIFRFINEFFRADTQRGSVGVLSTSQFISLLVVVAIVVVFIVMSRRGKLVSAGSSIPAAIPATRAGTGPRQVKARSGKGKGKGRGKKNRR